MRLRQPESQMIARIVITAASPAVVSWLPKSSMILGAVAVGTTLSGRPPHRSGRAALPHPALASGCDDKALRWIGMTDAGVR